MPSKLFALIALPLVGAIVFVQAQDETAADPIPAEVEVKKRASLTPEEQLQETEKIGIKGQQVAERVQNMLDDARRSNDIIRTTCLDDKLTQANANLRTLTARTEALKSAVSKQDTGGRNHEFTVISVLGQKFTILEQEAAQCLGEDMFETGSTKVVTTLDPGAPVVDPSYVPELPDDLIPLIPPPASAIR